MSNWNLIETERYARDFRHFEKKFPDELDAMLINLNAYFKTLRQVGHPMQIKAGFIHHEPDGIKAIDQKGGQQKVKLKQSRLYVYPKMSELRLYLLAIGDKRTQQQDIQLCRQWVRALNRK